MNRITFSAVLALSATLAMEKPACSQPADPNAGRDTYIQHCAACHGASGQGDGPLASGLKLPPSDLTRLAARHNNQFPSSKVADVVRHGGAPLGHGTVMPAWSKVFGVKGNPSVARKRIFNLTRYIESLQDK